ncbi:MAG: cytidylate kinase-like family protein [Erysipelotrichia bacterium]|nr:cytidylate kinase-like family protein [Erysipelotrichia bacterium]
MSDKIVITISREYGSGGREVGRLLAKKLQIPFYDKELLTYLAKNSEIDTELFKQIDDKIGFANFYFDDVSEFKVGSASLRALNALSVVQRIQNVQEKLIQQLAQQSCVLVGRCSDYILKDDPDVISVFIRANLMEKKKRAVNEYGEQVDNINEYLMKMDMKRANYYHFFTDRIWGKANNYDMVISTSRLSLENTAELIATLVSLKQKQK